MSGRSLFAPPHLSWESFDPERECENKPTLKKKKKTRNQLTTTVFLAKFQRPRLQNSRHNPRILDILPFGLRVEFPAEFRRRTTTGRISRRRVCTRLPNLLRNPRTLSVLPFSFRVEFPAAVFRRRTTTAGRISRRRVSSISRLGKYISTGIEKDALVQLFLPGFFLVLAPSLRFSGWRVFEWCFRLRWWVLSWRRGREGKRRHRRCCRGDGVSGRRKGDAARVSTVAVECWY